MWSTMDNMDLEETSKCFARAISAMCDQNLVKPIGIIQELLSPLFDYNESDSGEKSVYNFCRNLMSKARMEKECPIFALIYIERLITKAMIDLNHYN